MTTTHPSLLDVADVHTYYGPSYILQGVTLGAARGEVVAILGRNGVGKTTLVSTLAGFVPPRQGKVSIGGIDITGSAPERISRQGIALIPQGRRIFRSLTVHETLELGANLRRYDREGLSWTKDEVYAAFPRLAERRHNRAGGLSGGEQQMLAVGRALVGYPRVVLLDEPTEGLSPLLVKELHAVLVEVKRRGSTLLLIEQRLKFAMALADRVLLVNKGRIVFESTPEALQAAEEVRDRYLGV